MALRTKVKRNIDADYVLIHDAFEEFIIEKEAHNLAKDTIDNYKTSFKIFCNFYSIDDFTTLEVIEPSLFYKWINTMKQNDVKPTTINHYLRDTRAFFYWCMRRGYIEEDFKIEMVKGQEEQLKLFSDDELDLLLEKPKKYDSFPVWRAWAIVNWVLGTGNRAATVCAIKIGNIDFNHKEIAIEHTKNKKAQIIPLSSSLETSIKEYIRMWRNGASKEDYLFCNIADEKLTTNALRQAFEKYCSDRGVKHTNIHGLRHNFAKGWVKNNGNMFALQKVLGHSSLDMTRKYVKLFSEDIKEDFDRFNPLDTIKRSAKRKQTVRRFED